MYVCGTLLEGSLRDILVKKSFVLGQSSVKLWHEILKSENFDKNWNFSKNFQDFFSLFQFKIMKIL